MQIVVTVNGPGEVSSWLVPLAAELKRRMPNLRICAAVVPCVFSTGSEEDVIRAMPNVDATCSIAETRAWLLRNRVPEGFASDLPGFVLHLGGDTIFALLIAWRLRQRAVAYGEWPMSLGRFFDRIYYTGFSKVRGALGASDMIVGEMMVDGARMRCPVRDPDASPAPVIGLYPGSRDYMAKYILPFYAAVAEEVEKVRPGNIWKFGKSEFIAESFLRNIPDTNDGRPLRGVNLRFEEREGKRYLVTPAGIPIEIAKGGTVAASARVALTLPGTNTAELSAIGVPMIVTLPGWSSEVVPLPGIAGHIGRIPVLGKYVKRGLARLYLRSIKFASHPNRRADRMIVPELVGHTTPEWVASEVLAMLDADLGPMERELRELMGASGAAQRLAGELIDYLNEPEGLHEAAPAR